MSIDFPVTHQITFLRHGKSEANDQNILQGQKDSPLSSEGNQQAQALASYWSTEGFSFHKIISSPLGRAHETARIISEKLSVPIELNDKWMERDFGLAEGLLYEEIYSNLKDLPPRSIYEPAFETGESDWDLYIRAASAVQSLTYEDPGKYLIVAHGAILNSALSSILGITPRPSTYRIRFRFYNTGYAMLEYNGNSQSWTILSLNNTYHLLRDESHNLNVDRV